jgi:tryptophanase
MYRSEVEEWLYSIGLPELYSSFVEDGFTTLDSIKRMRQSDIDSIVDRNGYMVVLNEEIDRLNYGENNFSSSTGDYRPAGGNNDYLDRSSRASTYFEGQANDSYPSREALIYRYEIGGVPAVGFASRHLARRAKSKTRKTRGTSLSRVSVERYVPNSGSEEYEALFANKRAASVAASIREMEIKKANEKIAEFQRKREEDRQRRARTGK